MRYDAVIVGSGPAGGYAAKTLSEAGLRVLVIEAGPGRLARLATDAYERARRSLGYRIEHDPAAIRRQRIQSSCYAWAAQPHAFVDDLDNPYTTDSDGEFAWIRCRQVGGRMLVRQHGLQFYRFSELDFTAGARDRASDAWPIGYADIAPYYERVEQWMRLRGTLNNLPQLPDSVLVEEVEPSTGDRLLASALRRHWKDRSVIPGRTARPPAPIGDALRTRRCRLKTNTIVTGVTKDPDRPRVTGVRFVDRATSRDGEASGRVVILCASPIESARLLMASATRQYPDGLANSSGLLGRYLMDHVHLTGMTADLPAGLDDARRDPRWAYIPRFQNVHEDNESFARGYGVQVFTDGRLIGLTAFGEMLPHPDNRVTLDPAIKDKWGVPVARIRCVNRENELAIVRHAFDACGHMLEAAGMTPWRSNAAPSTPGLSVHEVGTARMGNDARTSVLNSFCQSWDLENLFVMDGSCFVSQGVQNPTLTILALAARSSDYVIDLFRRGEL